MKNNELRKTFIDKAKLKYDDKYDYSEVIYINSRVKVDIICKEHGVFQKTPSHHINGSQGCPKCGYRNLSLSKLSKLENFIEKSIKIHGNKYDYSKSLYKNAISKIKIICNKHDEIIEITPNSHLNGQGCPYCSGSKLNKDIFVDRSRKIHGDKYDYSIVDYKHSQKYVTITCKKHGNFKQKPNCHLNGQGCPSCKLSKGENKIVDILDKLNIKYLKQYKFNECKYKENLIFDFYIPEHNLCIEYDGQQHFNPVDYFGGIERFKEDKKRDLIKNNYCLENKIKLVRIPYYSFNIIEDIILENL